MVNVKNAALLPSRVIFGRQWIEELRSQFKLAPEQSWHSSFRWFVNQYQPDDGMPSTGDHNVFAPFSPFNETGQARFCTVDRRYKHTEILANEQADGLLSSIEPQDIVELLRKTHYGV